MDIYNPVLALSIGTPSQMIVARFDYSNPYLVIFDSECGEKPPECPRYCKDGNSVLPIFYAIHILELLRGSCSPICRSFDRVSKELYCGSSSRSSTHLLYFL